MADTNWHAQVTQNGSRQSGVAAIEFGISIIIVLMFLFGIVSYGALFWAQQKVSYLAAEGGRYAVAASIGNPAASDALTTAQIACDHVQKIASTDLLLGAVDDANGSLNIQVSCIPEPGPCSSCVTINVSVNVTEWPLLNIMDKLAGIFPSSPDNPSSISLASRAVVQIMSRSPVS